MGGMDGRFTRLTDAQVALVRAVGSDPLALCRAAQGLLLHPGDAFGAALTEDRLTERGTRAASAIVARALELDPSPLSVARPADRRVVGTCRHFAVVGAAFLLAAGVAARARCGFAAYFVEGKWVDHWITEWRGAGGGWVRTDVEWLDVAPMGEFLSGGEAWLRVRRGDLDASSFGVAGTDNWGPGEIRGNVMRDLAALEGVEVLPWDTWGPMGASYEGRTGATFDRLCDEIAAACASDDGAEERARLLAALGPLDIE